MNPLAANQDPCFLNKENVAFTLDQIQSNKVKTKLKGLLNGVCLMLCLLVKPSLKRQKLKYSFCTVCSYFTE